MPAYDLNWLLKNIVSFDPPSNTVVVTEACKFMLSTCREDAVFSIENPHCMHFKKARTHAGIDTEKITGKPIVTEGSTFHPFSCFSLP